MKPAEPEKPAAPAKPAEPVKKEKTENKATAPAPSNKKKKQKLDQPAVPRSAMEQREDEEMKELKAMLFGKPKAPAKSAPKQTETLPASPLTGLVFAEDKAAPEPPKTPAEPEKTPEKPPVTPQPTPRMETAAEPESGKEKTTEIPAFRFFGKADDEVKAPTRETAPGPDDSMSLPLIGLDNEGNPSEEPPVEALKAAPAAEASTAEVPVDGTPAAEAEPASEEAPATPEEVGEKLRKMGAALTLRCVLGGILAAVLLHFGLVAEGLLAPLAALDPVVAPAAFYATNLLFLCIGFALMGTAFGPIGVFLPELFDANVRYSGSGIGYNLAAIVGAAFVPTIATWLSHHWGVHSVGLYLGVMAVCCLVAVLSCKETKDVDFTK